MTKFKNKIIEFHILQSFPVSCLNRDDVGAPKTAIVGGVTRARVSSQCWKRAVRMALRDLGITIGVRTKKLEDRIADKCKKLGAEEEVAKAWAAAICSVIAKDTLIFLSQEQFDKLIEECATEAEKEGFKVTKEKGKKEDSEDKLIANINEKTIMEKLYLVLGDATKYKHINALDIILFGRMLANASQFDIEAAASFSHAISTHKVVNDIDFFTAVDDLEEDHQGSGHLGVLEFNSATYYRYVSLNLGQLETKLETTEDIEKAVEAFTKALFIAVPHARQNTFAANSPWDYAKIFIRSGQRIQVPFEVPLKVSDSNSGISAVSIETMQEYLKNQEKQCGSLFKKIKECTYGIGESNIDEIINELTQEIRNISNA